MGDAWAPPNWAIAPQSAARLVPAAAAGGAAAAGADVDLGARPFYVIGREAPADIVIDHPGVSRRAAALVHHARGLYVIDLASREGVEIDGARLPPNKPTRLADGARLVVGPAAAAFTVRVAPPPAAPARPAPPADGPAEVRASHLLVKHARSRRPASWKEDPVTRSPEEALAMVEAFRAQLVECGGGDSADLAARFAALAAVESHCSSASKGGDLGAFGRGAMQRAFEEPAFVLAVGELSAPVSSDSGWHLILRTG